MSDVDDDDRVRTELEAAIESGALNEAEKLLERAIHHVATARAMPMSASVMINRDELLDLLEEAQERIPEELRAGRWLLKERDEFLARTRREGDEIIDQARARAARMVQRSEVVAESERRARKIVEDAESNARAIRMQCEDFCDQRLAQFEIVLERTMKMVTAGREHLAAPSMQAQGQPAIGVESEDDLDTDAAARFFDQDAAGPPPETDA